MVRAWLFGAVWAGCLSANLSLAQAYQPTDPDPSRPAATALPPEAAPADRSLYATGLAVELGAGVDVFTGALAEVVSPGPALALALEFEPLRWLSLRAVVEGSMYATAEDGPAPAAAVERYGGFLGARARVPLWDPISLLVDVDFGLTKVSWNVLRVYGVPLADVLKPAYGAGLGFDVHLDDAHHSLGLVVRARRYPSLSVHGEGATLAAQVTLFVRHVF